jgi:hypothetical protein
LIRIEILVSSQNYPSPSPDLWQPLGVGLVLRKMVVVSLDADSLSNHRFGNDVASEAAVEKENRILRLQF